MHRNTFFILPSPLPPAKLLRDCAIITWREVGAPKLITHIPPLIKEKLISPPTPHIMIILRLTPHLEKKSPPIDSLIPSLLVGFLPPVQTSLQMTLRRMSKSFKESSESLDSELVSSSHELGDSSSSTASLALRFPAACVCENSINQLSPAFNYFKTFLP